MEESLPTLGGTLVGRLTRVRLSMIRNNNSVTRSKNSVGVPPWLRQTGAVGSGSGRVECGDDTYSLTNLVRVRFACMARLARVVIPGLAHHVTQRGNRREADGLGRGDKGTGRKYPQRNLSSVQFLDSRLLAEGKCALVFLLIRPLFWATLLQSQQAFRFPFQRTDELRVSQRATSVSIPTNHDQFRLALPSIQILTPASTRPSASPHLHRQPSLLRGPAAVDRSTGPRPPLSRVHHTGTHRIQLRIPQRFPQMLLVQRARIVSPLPDMAG
jgi:hypothetical protein